MNHETSSRDEVIRVRAVASGLVQGVWYRETCRREAQRLGVSGWVRNRPDGRVELEAEGTRSSVDALLAWARRGPTRAIVESLDAVPVAVAPASDPRLVRSAGFVVR